MSAYRGVTCNVFLTISVYPRQIATDKHFQNKASLSLSLSYKSRCQYKLFPGSRALWSKNKQGLANVAVFTQTQPATSASI